jgi:hypothetical protein
MVVSFLFFLPLPSPTKREKLWADGMTFLRRGVEMSIGAGGAVTWLSDAEREWEEVLVKVGSVVGDVM